MSRTVTERDARELNRIRALVDAKAESGASHRDSGAVRFQMVRVKITGAVSGRSGYYHARRIEGAPPVDTSGNIAESHAGTVPDADNAIVAHLAEIGGSGGGLSAGSILLGQWVGSTSEGKLLVHVSGAGGGGPDELIPVLLDQATADGNGFRYRVRTFGGTILLLNAAPATVNTSTQIARNAAGAGLARRDSTGQYSLLFAFETVKITNCTS